MQLILPSQSGVCAHSTDKETEGQRDMGKLCSEEGVEAGYEPMSADSSPRLHLVQGGGRGAGPAERVTVPSLSLLMPPELWPYLPPAGGGSWVVPSFLSRLGCGMLDTELTMLLAAGTDNA